MADNDPAVLDDPSQTSTGNPPTDPNAAADPGKSQDPPIDDNTKSTPQVPESYDLSLPKDTELHEDFLEDVRTYAKDNQLTQDQAASLLVREVASEQEFLDFHLGETQRISDGWLQESKDDKNFGGDKWEATTARVKSYMGKFFGEEAMKLFDETGMGNHPALVEGFNKLALQGEEDSLEKGRKAEAPKGRKDIMYPNG